MVEGGQGEDGRFLLHGMNECHTSVEHIAACCLALFIQFNSLPRLPAPAHPVTLPESPAFRTARWFTRKSLRACGCDRRDRPAED